MTTARCCVPLVFLFSIATLSRGEEPTSESVPDEPPIAEADRQHWSFQIPVRPTLPEVRDAGWCRTPIDRFILAKLEAEGLRPQPPADPATLLRRLTYDLIGLPPREEELDESLRQFSPSLHTSVSPSNKNEGETEGRREGAITYETLVDRLLASPAYGERWAQHWLDLARFADTDGYEHDYTRNSAWKYRDWVIDALNRDLPYDRFLQLQLAGDELAEEESDAAIATGFLLAGPDMPDINLKDERRHMALNEITSTVGAVFLGLQIGCAQCHDHKFEPLSQHDFYRLRSVFEPAALFDAHPQGRVVVDRPGPWNESRLMVRGDFRRPGPVVEPGVPRIADPFGTQIDRGRDEVEARATTSGRRSALARWLTRPDHPLTARLIVNRMWQEHFGQGLCRQPSDFGLMGDEPTHPELLDWLATELVRRDWSLKALHRLILTSAVYQQASRPVNVEAWQLARRHDPSNQWLARMNRRRLDGESIRDTLLAVSERLNPACGGPGVMPPLPEELVSALLKNQWQVSPDETDHRRRSIYLFVRRNLRYPLFEAFDRPDAQQSCPRRNRSTIAPQALVLMNSEFVRQQANELARYVAARAAGDEAEEVRLIYQRCLGRSPTVDELMVGIDFVGRDGVNTSRRLADFCLAVFNLNEFVYVD